MHKQNKWNQSNKTGNQITEGKEKERSSGIADKVHSEKMRYKNADKIYE